METNDNALELQRRNLLTWLFNPFLYLAGVNSLIIGIVFILIAGFTGSLSNSHFDGILDFHAGAPAPLWIFLSEGLINWLLMGILLFIGGMIISKSKFRAIDVFGTQALARFPTVILTLVVLTPGFKRFGRQIALQLSNIRNFVSENTLDFIIFMAVLIVIVLMVIWMVYLMYRGFSISCNVAKGKAISVFIAALVIGEIISKIIFILVVQKFHYIL